MDTGGRRRPPGTLRRALGLVALLTAVLSLPLGTAAGASIASPAHAPAFSHALVQGHPAVPPGPDEVAFLAEVLVLPVVAGLLVVAAAGRRVPRAVHERRPRGRAPPG